MVPILNARYALNAANARWGSLYDALYGTDAIPSEDRRALKRAGLQPVRGAKVIAFARQVLDDTAPLATGSHKDSTGYRVEGGQLVVSLANGSTTTGLKDASQFGLPGQRRRAFVGAAATQRPAPRYPDRPQHAHRPVDAAGVSDLVLEAALSTILDLEDSVAAVDAGGQGAGLQQLAGHHPGDADRAGHQGWQDLHARPEP